VLEANEIEKSFSISFEDVLPNEFSFIFFGVDLLSEILNKIKIELETILKKPC